MDGPARRESNRADLAGWYSDCHFYDCVERTCENGREWPEKWRCDMPVKNPDEIEEKTKPSQAEGEREQPGEEKPEEQKEFVEPAKPSQAEGERKPYT